MASPSSPSWPSTSTRPPLVAVAATPPSPQYLPSFRPSSDLPTAAMPSTTTSPPPTPSPTVSTTGDITVAAPLPRSLLADSSHPRSAALISEHQPVATHHSDGFKPPKHSHRHQNQILESDLEGGEATAITIQRRRRSWSGVHVLAAFLLPRRREEGCVSAFYCLDCLEEGTEVLLLCFGSMLCCGVADLSCCCSVKKEKGVFGFLAASSGDRKVKSVYCLLSCSLEKEKEKGGVVLLLLLRECRLFTVVLEEKVTDVGYLLQV